MKNCFLLFLWSFLVCCLECGCNRDQVNQALHGDEQILRDHPILKKHPIIFSVNREQYGFSPLPEKARLSISEDDKLIHVAVISATSIKQIQFLKRESGEIEWHVEKEDFTGPNVYQGKFVKQHEVIQLWYYGFRETGSKIDYNYYGEDPVLSAKRPLTLDDVKPYLEKWGSKEKEVRNK